MYSSTTRPHWPDRRQSRPDAVWTARYRFLILVRSPPICIYAAPKCHAISRPTIRLRRGPDPWRIPSPARSLYLRLPGVRQKLRCHRVLPQSLGRDSNNRHIPTRPWFSRHRRGQRPARPAPHCATAQLLSPGGRIRRQFCFVPPDGRMTGWRHENRYGS